VILDYTLISTIYSIEPAMFCITQFSPKKVIILREEDANETKLNVEKMLIDIVGSS